MPNETNLIKRVTVELDNLGIPKNIDGYTYIRKAILITYQDFVAVRRITTRIYPVIAEQYETTSSRVERCIRHAVETVLLSSISKRFSRKPTNSEFIAEIADQLRVEDGLV